MKTLIIPMLALLLAAPAWAGDSAIIMLPDTPTQLRSFVAKDDREAYIRQWAASGEICRVIGHRWDDGPSTKWLNAQSGVSTCFAWTKGDYIHCTICEITVAGPIKGWR